MQKKHRYQKLGRQIITSVMMLMLLASTMPAQMALAVETRSNKPVHDVVIPTTPQVNVKRGPRSVSIFKPQLSFSAQPTDLEISTARVFPEPLAPLAGKPELGEDQALANALTNFKSRKNPDDASALTNFLSSHPHSRWRPALEMNLGLFQFDRGYLTDALTYWNSAWEATKNETDRAVKAVADRSIAELVTLEARLGRLDELQKHLGEIKNRTLLGSIETKVDEARGGLQSMLHSPGTSFKCGPFALNSILNLDKKTNGQHPILKGVPSTRNGTSLAQLKDLADKVGLKYQIAKRAKGTTFVVPSVVHWKVDHFGAITAFKKGKYQIKDPTFGTNAMAWITPQALESQTDGYFLIPGRELPAGWQTVSKQEAESVWGKGDSQNQNQKAKGKGCPKTNPPPPPDCNTGMARAAAFTMQATLNVMDTPLSYKPPVGPKMDFTVNYNYLEADQPGTFTFPNFGPDWSFNWVAYLQLDSSLNAQVFAPGGGSEIYNYTLPDNVSNPYPPNVTSQAILSVVGVNAYQRQLPDGSIEVYNQPDGTGKIFMTQMIDPQGNSAFIVYDANFRVTAIRDALGQETSITYVSNTIGNVGYYKISRITDPFTRQANFAYDPGTTYLVSITDVINLVSQFVSDATTSLITAMTTPYGTTSFYQYTPPGGTAPTRGLRFNFPDKSSAVLENWIGEVKSSYYWDREQAALYPSDPGNMVYTHCTTTKFLFDASQSIESPVINFVKPPLESAITYTTEGETGGNYLGTTNRPIRISRLVKGNGPTNATLYGTVTAGDVLTITVNDSGLPGGQQAINYTVQLGNTLIDIATGLKNAINANTNLQSINVSATSLNEVVTITSNSTNTTTYSQSTSAGATETIVFGANVNITETATIGGTATTGDVLTLSVFDAGLSGGQANVNYTVQSGNTLTDIATGLKNAINANTSLQAIGVSASSSAAVVNMTSTSANLTSYAQSTSTGATETISLGVASNSNMQAYNYQFNAAGLVTQAIDPIGRTFSYLYSANNVDLLEKRETKNGNNFLIGKWIYNNSKHVPNTYIDGSGQQTQYAYNSFGELTTLTDANSNVTTLTYDSDGYLTQINGPLSGNLDITTFTYDSFGRLLTVTDSEGYTLTYSYDAANRLTQVLYPDTTTEQIIYDKLDAVMFKDRNGRWTTRNYDSMDQLAFDVDPLSRKTIYSWCNCGSLATLTDPANHITTWEHDLEGRVTRKIYADSTDIDYVYEAFTSRLQSKTDALNQTTNYVYNLDNTLSQMSYTNPVNPTSTVNFTYDQNYPRISTVQNGWGTVTYFYNNYITNPFATPTTGGGRLASVTNNVISNSTTTYTYDALGRTTNRSINSSTNSITWTYDAMSRITAEANTLGNFAYQYVDNTPGSSKGTLRLSSITYPNSQVTNFSYYNNTGDQRLQQISNLNPSAQILSQFGYTYNSAGEINQWTQQRGTNTAVQNNFAYDLAGQLITNQTVIGNPTPQYINQYFYYAYDLASNRTTVQVNGAQTATIGGTATAGDTVTITIIDSGLSGGQMAINYTVQGGDTLTSIATALKNAINADANLQAINVSAASNAAVVSITAQSVNATNFTGSTSGGATETVTVVRNTNVTQATFNNVNELTGLAAGGSTRFQGTTNKAVKSASVNSTPMTLTYSKAFIGNTTLSTGSNSASVQAVDGGNNTATLNKTVTVDTGSSTSLTYDSNGNLTNDGTNTYQWDAENRLVQINYPGSGNNSQFAFDGLGRCAKIIEQTGGSTTSTKQFIWCGNQRCEERDGTGSLTKQFFSLGQTVSGTNYFYTTDHLSSVREMTNSSGTIQAQYTYDPYGIGIIISETVPVDFRYAGYYSHSRSGLNLTLYRAYNSILGRWLSRDPLGERLTGSISMVSPDNESAEPQDSHIIPNLYAAVQPLPTAPVASDSTRSNLYQYCGSNPVGFTDPLGLDPNPVINTLINIGKTIENAIHMVNPWQGAYDRARDAGMPRNACPIPPGAPGNEKPPSGPNPGLPHVWPGTAPWAPVNTAPRFYPPNTGYA
jgi:RHS repeat-associated protein